jgi:hypothetical protein
VEGHIQVSGIQGILSKPCAIIFYLFIHFTTSNLQELLQDLDLLQNRALACAASGVLQLYCTLVVEAFDDVIAQPRVDALQLLEAQLVHGDVVVFGQCDDATGNVVALTEWHALPDEVVGKLGGKHLGSQRSVHLLCVDVECRQNSSSDLDRVADGLDVVDEGLDGLLEILVVGRRQALDGDVQTSHVSESATALAADQLERVGILLLWHERASGRVCVGQANEAELQTRVDDEIFSPAGHLEHEAGTPLHSLEDEVAVADGVERVCEEALEAELLGHGIAVDVEGVAGQRTAAERRAVDALDDLAEALELGGEGGSVGEDPVRPADGLCLLEMCVTGHLRLLALVR